MLTRRKLIASLPVASLVRTGTIDPAQACAPPMAGDDVDRLIAALSDRLGGKARILVALAAEMALEVEDDPGIAAEEADAEKERYLALAEWAQRRSRGSTTTVAAPIDAEYDAIIDNLVDRMGKAQAIMGLCASLVSRLELKDDVTYAEYRAEALQLDRLRDWAYRRCLAEECGPAEAAKSCG